MMLPSCSRSIVYWNPMLPADAGRAAPAISAARARVRRIRPPWRQRGGVLGVAPREGPVDPPRPADLVGTLYDAPRLARVTRLTASPLSRRKFLETFVSRKTSNA